MSRPWVLVYLLLLIVFTSHFDWKLQYGNGVEVSANASRKLKYFSGRDDIKEKIILSQEKNIQGLNNLVKSLREQLLQCRVENEVPNTTTTSLAEATELLIDLGLLPVLED